MPEGKDKSMPRRKTNDDINQECQSWEDAAYHRTMKRAARKAEHALAYLREAEALLSHYDILRRPELLDVGVTNARQHLEEWESYIKACKAGILT
jgi:hypothetical protein